MADSNKSRRGRPRVTLLEAFSRWTSGEKRYVERHIPRLLDALYREMITFEPVGLLTQAHLLRFMVQYRGEICCLFSAPFNGIKTPEQKESQRLEVIDYVNLLLRVGAVPRREDDPAEYERAVVKAFEVRQAELAYQQAHTHVWRLLGGTGTPPKQPDPDTSLMSQREIMCVEKLRVAYAARAARYREAEHNTTDASATAQAPAAGADHTGTTDASAAAADEERLALQAVEYGSPADVPLPDADRIDWPGKQHVETPRDMMRPYLTKIGRLDLLDGYSDEIVQYGERVEYQIDGMWR